jgi:hypothetical protein
VNGTIGATAPAAGAFTTVASSGTVNFGSGAVQMDASGNLGLWAGPAAWAVSGAGILQLANAGAVWGNPNGGLYLSNNLYASSTGKRYLYAGAASEVVQVAGEHIFFSTSAVGAPGGAATLAEKMRLDASGNLLVGATSTNLTNGGLLLFPGINSELGVGHSATSGSGSSFLTCKFSNTIIGSISQSGTTQVNFNGNSVPPSDRRLKTNIVDAPPAIPLLMLMGIKSFDWIGDDDKHQTYGAIAQDLQAISPELVPEQNDPNAMLGIDYGKAVPILIKGFQEQQALIVALTARLAVLEAA